MSTVSSLRFSFIFFHFLFLSLCLFSLFIPPHYPSDLSDDVVGCASSFLSHFFDTPKAFQHDRSSFNFSSLIHFIKLRSLISFFLSLFLNIYPSLIAFFSSSMSSRFPAQMKPTVEKTIFKNLSSNAQVAPPFQPSLSRFGFCVLFEVFFLTFFL
jgi:hypothetical protein